MCKELHTDFWTKPNEVTLTEANGNSLETINSAKMVGITIRGDLKWNNHVDNSTVKGSQQIYLLKQLKHAGIDCISLIHFYCPCIHSVFEYASQTFHSSLPVYLSNQIERVQKQVLRIIYPDALHRKALEDANLKTFLIGKKNYVQVYSIRSKHKLADLLPTQNNVSQYNLRNKHILLLCLVSK